MKRFAILVLLLSLSFSQTTWKIDAAHSVVGFAVSHMVISETEGVFKEFKGDVVTHAEDFSDAQIHLEINTASINTNHEGRDKHLKNEDFFNVEKFPKTTFKSKSFTKIDDKNYKIVGDLTMHGVTNEVILDAIYNGMIKDPWGNTRAGFKASAKLDRYKYDLKYNSALEAGGLAIGQEVALNIKVELIKAK